MEININRGLKKTNFYFFLTLKFIYYTFILSINLRIINNLKAGKDL
jgi:hypothetical protein